MPESSLLSDLSPNGVLRITMNRPEVHNAFDDQQILRLTRILEDTQADRAIRVVIIAGTGKSFSAGGDINYMRRMGGNSYEDNLTDAGQLARLMKTLNFLPQPTIARVQGAAMGGGVGLVSCCDYAIGSGKAKFALSEVKLGMVPATISPYVVATIGEKAARRLFMSGLPVNADEALTLGLLSAVVEAAELDKAVDELALSLLKNAPDAVRLSKQLAIEMAAGGIDENKIEHSIRLIADVRNSAEGREGLSAFLEKRTPGWVQ